MKNLLIPILALALAITTSCSKNRDCVCTYTDSQGASVSVTSQVKGSKSSAKKACEKNDQEWADVNGSCKLK